MALDEATCQCSRELCAVWHWLQCLRQYNRFTTEYRGGWDQGKMKDDQVMCVAGSGRSPPCHMTNTSLCTMFNLFAIDLYYDLGNVSFKHILNIWLSLSIFCYWDWSGHSWMEHPSLQWSDHYIFITFWIYCEVAFRLWCYPFCFVGNYWHTYSIVIVLAGG